MQTKHLFCCFLLMGSLSSLNCFDLGITNIFNSAVDVSTGVVEDLTNRLPTVNGLFEISKELIAGYPFEYLFDAINQICSSALSSRTITPKFKPDISKMNFQLRTACGRYSFPLLNADEMFSSPYFDTTKKVVILVSGWTTTINQSDPIDILAKAYNCRGGVNIVAIDTAKYVDTLYSWSAFNTESLGVDIGEGLAQLIKYVPVENIHLIGHSLGAHILGAAGRHFQFLTGKNIPRITGLDPARPCFNEGQSLSGLQRGDADFIDVIHSNPGVLGKRDPLGDIDFYPGGLDPLPTGCFNIYCAHMRSCEYFAESVYPENENNFLATRCTSLTSLREGKCVSKNVPMGYAVPINSKGQYFLEVNGESPYGIKGTKARYQTYAKCGICTCTGPNCVVG